MTGTIILAVLTILFVSITLMPLVRSDHWTFRILEYPRLQKFFIGIAIAIGLVVFKSMAGIYFWWLLVPLFGCLCYLAIKIFPYTALAAKEMKQVKSGQKDRELKVLTANVLQDNKNYNKLLEQIKENDPHIIFLVETNFHWQEQIDTLLDRYPYSINYPMDNTYGLLFYSRLKLVQKEIRFIVEKEVPSIDVTLLLEDGTPVRIFGLHPKPPVPGESVYSTAKDKELMKIAMEIEHFDDPCVVMGDLNDVAWSHVTELFRKVSSLIDPRRGRGFFSTFNAKHWWMRFPLDYIFCSSHFGVCHMERLGFNGSDHFPMFIHLQYHQELRNTQKTPEADQQEEEEAKEKANDEASH